MLAHARPITLVLTLALGLSGLCACTAPDAAQTAPSATEQKDTQAGEAEHKLSEEERAIATHVVENFRKLTEIPRPSHHEEAVGAFFMDWARTQGAEPRQDEVGNVIFDVGATAGMEDRPKVALQAHMDMVCVGDSPDYDPVRDPIKLVVDYDAGTLTADGTSLGADDGIGCAIIMSMVEGLAPHGPLRVILTVDEEDGMTGITNLDASVVADLAYLINVDSERADEVVVSSAGGVEVDVTSEEVATKAPEGNLTMEVAVSGLTGGHSGMDIDKGRANALYVLKDALAGLTERGIAYELARFEGGTASNAIPNAATATIVVDEADQEAVRTAVQELSASIASDFGKTDPDLAIEEGVINEQADVVVTDEATATLFAYMDGIVQGVHSMSADVEGLVESSSNLGVARLTPEGLEALAYARSSNQARQDEIAEQDGAVADELGLAATMEQSGEPWPYNPQSALLPLAQEVYLEQQGTEIKVSMLHATLECGNFAVYNPDLDMISIGPDLEDVHSTSEMLHLKTIPKTFNLLAGILAGIGGVA